MSQYHLQEKWQAPTWANCTPVHTYIHSCISLHKLGGGGGGVKSKEAGYKETKIKSAAELYGNEDPTMGLVRAHEEQAVVMGTGH